MKLAFEVVLGDYAGTQITERFWSRILVARAAALFRGQLVDILVRTKQSVRGNRFAVVFDFVPVGARTAPEAVSGIPENPAAARDAIARAVEPEGTLVEYQLPRWIDADEDRFPVAIADDLWRSLLATIGPLAPAAGNESTPAPVLSDEAEEVVWELDEAAAAHAWVLVGGEDRDARPACEPWESFYARQAAADPAAAPSVGLRVSAYEYTNEMRTYHAAHEGCMRLHAGMAWARWLTVRLVGQDDLADALEPARRLARALETAGVPRDQIVVVVEASHRAIRIHIPSSCAGAGPQIGFEVVSNHFWRLVANVALMHHSRLKETEFKGFMVPVDSAWYTPISRDHYQPHGMLAAVNVEDRDTGLYVVAVTPKELHELGPDELRQLARQPRLVAWPSWRAAPIQLLCDCWEYAVEVELSRAARFKTPEPDEAYIYSDTFRFLYGGAPGRDGSVACIRAALNLFQFEAPAALVSALLGPAAALSGLTPEETRRLITWAATKHQRNGGTVPDLDTDGEWGG